MALPYGRRTIVGIEGIVKMSNDRYMKLILTVIAISLTIIAFRPFFAPTTPVPRVTRAAAWMRLIRAMSQDGARRDYAGGQ